MGLLDILRKLGIVRFGGTAATYTNAKERPIELQDSGVFNAKKDLVGGEKKAEPKPPELPKK